MFRYLPEPASEVAPRIDWLHNIITDLSVFFTVAIVGAMLYFAIRYRQKGDTPHETPRIEGSNLLEVIWTVVPTLICVFIAYYGSVIYLDMVDVPADEEVVEIYVKARKWQWDFEYPNGKQTTNQFVLPVNKQAKLILRSSDVLHSFFLPEMRVKNDAIPGTFTYVTFKPVRTGDYNAFCTEYCGKDHSSMMAKLTVVSEDEYDRWLTDRSAELAKAAMSPIDLGRNLYTEKGCNACHSLSGQKIIGPSFLESFGQARTFTDGSTGVVDEEYISQSIQYPNDKIVEGYPPNQMPAFEGQLTADEIQGIIAFIKSVDGSAPVEEVSAAEEVDVDSAALSPVQLGQKIYETKLCKTCHSLDGSKLVGPSFKGLYGRKGTLQDGSAYEANDTYIKQSILEPMSQLVEGYAGGMPPYAGQLSDEEITAVIEFLKTVE